MKPAVFLTFVVLWMAQAAFADDSRGNHAVWGIGQSSCHVYSQARAAGEFTEHKTYLMGYLTACNTFIPETYNITGSKDLSGVLSWLDEYCKKTPVDSFERALSQIVAAFRESRATKAPSSQSWGRPPSSNGKN